MEGSGFEITMKKVSRGSKKAWKSFLKQTINTLPPVICMAVGDKSKKPQIGKATANILRDISGGKLLSLTDLHGSGLRLKVMWIKFKNSLYNKIDEVQICTKEKKWKIID